MLTDTAIIQLYPVDSNACVASLLDIVGGNNEFDILFGDFIPNPPRIQTYLNGLVPGITFTINPLQCSMTFNFNPPLDFTNIEFSGRFTYPGPVNQFLRYFFTTQGFQDGLAFHVAQLKLLLGDVPVLLDYKWIPRNAIDSPYFIFKSTYPIPPILSPGEDVQPNIPFVPPPFNPNFKNRCCIKNLDCRSPQCL